MLSNLLSEVKWKSLSHVWLCNTMDCGPRLLRPWDSSGKNPGAGCHFLLQGIFPIQESKLYLLLGRQILYHWGTWKAPYCTIIFHKSLEIQWRNILTGCRSKSKNIVPKVEIPIITILPKLSFYLKYYLHLNPVLLLWIMAVSHMVGEVVGERVVYKPRVRSSPMGTN